MHPDQSSVGPGMHPQIHAPMKHEIKPSTLEFTLWVLLQASEMSACCAVQGGGSPLKYWQVAGGAWVVHDSAKVLWLVLALVALWLFCWRPRS